jgi:hypothetical protein
MRFRRTIHGLVGLAAMVAAGAVTGAVAGAVIHPTAAHAASTMGGQITRAEVLARAANWFSRNPIAYDSSDSTEISDIEGTGHYRPDCSGFVSMAWHTSDSSGGYNTASLPSVAHAISKSALEPGDALVIYATINGVLNHHAVLFEAWQPDHRHFSYYSFGSDNVKHATGVADQWDSPNPLGDIDGSTLDSHPLASYTAYEYNNIVDGATPQLTDLNADGMPELVGRNASGALMVYPHGDTSTIASASWSTPIQIGTGWNIYDVILFADLNFDGLPEIIARNPSVDGGALMVYPHLDGATAIAGSSWGTPVEVGTGWDMYDKIMFGDLNHDGLPEIVARKPSASGGALYAYPHVAGVTAIAGSSWSASVQIGSGWNIFSEITLGDLNSDGYPELVAINATSGALVAYPHQAGVTSIAGTSWTASVTVGSSWNQFDTLAVSDLDGNGLPELVVRKPASSNGAMIAYPHQAGVTAIAGTSWTTPVQIGSGWNIFT